MITAQIENETFSAPRMPYFWTFWVEARPSPLAFFQRTCVFLYLWAHLYNLIKQNNNFSILKKIENPLLNPILNPLNTNSCNNSI